MKYVEMRERAGTRYGARFGLLSAAFAFAMIATLIPAAGAKTVVTLQSPGVRKSHSVAVETTTTIQCVAPKPGTVNPTATLTVLLTQNQPTGVVRHSGSSTLTGADFPCDGKVHHVVVPIVTPSASGVYDAGKASGRVALKVCDPTCSVATSARTIKIV
jgi:hypothetical protein